MAGLLRIRVRSAEKLAARDIWGTSDPYCVLSVGSSSARSRTIPRTLDPTWDQEFTLFVRCVCATSSRVSAQLSKHRCFARSRWRSRLHEAAHIARCACSEYGVRGRQGVHHPFIPMASMQCVLFRRNVSTDLLTVKVLDEDRIGSDDLIGTCRVSVAALADGEPRDLSLHVRGSNEHSLLHLSATYIPLTGAPAMPGKHPKVLRIRGKCKESSYRICGCCCATQ